MSDQTGLLATNVALLRTRASRIACAGMIIAICAVLIATAGTAYVNSGSFAMAALLSAQTGNPALWLLDLMPFAFAFWGQYSALLLARDAGSMVLEQTRDLRARQLLLEAKSIQHSAMDDLTGLATRSFFLDMIEDAIETSRQSSHHVGVLVVDVKDFKEVNSVLGLSNGDRVLRSIGRRLLDAAGGDARVARLGGDTFALLMRCVANRDALLLMAKRIEKRMEPPMTVGDQTLTLQLSGGAAVSPGDAQDAESLLSCAELAQNRARESGTHLVFCSVMRSRSPAAAGGLSAELRTAMEQNQLTLYAQPVVDAESRQILAVETLLRWEHPQRGMVMPGEFIPRAERSGQILDLSHWVMKRALQLAQELQRVGQELDVSVNISTRSMLDPHLPDMLSALLAEGNVDAGRLIMEISEEAAMSDRVSTQHVIRRLAEIGVQISIDDFGTGYSQLASLQKLPVSEIKIDRSFVADLLASDADGTLVQATIKMGQALGLRIVGEGVEDEWQAAHLSDLGCHRLQGFYIARPMPASELLGWMERWKLYGAPQPSAQAG